MQTASQVLARAAARAAPSAGSLSSFSPSVSLPGAAARRGLAAAAKPSISVGIIGAGRIGLVHAETLAYRCPAARTEMIVDFFPDVAAGAAAKFGIPKSGKEYMEIIENPDIDAVWICSPSSMHKEQIIAASNAGKHIFCEKPLAIELAEADDVIAAVEKSGVKMMLAFQRRFDSNFARVKKAIEEGVVGDPYTFRLTSRDPAPPPIEYILKSGGLHNDMAIHDFDVARYLMGCECEEVIALGACRVDPKIGTEGGDIDTALTILKFENGAFGTIDNCRKSTQGYDQRVEVFGSAGQVSFDNNFPNSMTVADGSSIRRDTPFSFFMDRYMDAYRNETIEFVNAIVNDTAPPTSARDGRAAMVIAKAAKLSLKENRPVKTSEIKA
jgi:myo-inositol 2-dehydrogenase / D-chiro-inositol 1-dehydrogenase